MNPCRKPEGKRTSFSKLVAAFSIVSVLLIFGVAHLRGLRAGKAVAASNPTAEELFEQARATAIGKGTTAQVLIDQGNAQDRDGQLRRTLLNYGK